GKAQLYQPGIDQVTEYSIASKEDAEGMFALGFGGRGHDLLKSFSVKYGGDEAVDGTKTAKLELTPKSARVHNMFSLITLWIDASRGVSLKQQFDEPSGDYRRAFYTNIKLNPRLSDDLFKLNTTTKTDRKSTRLNSSHVAISYAVFCLKKKKKKRKVTHKYQLNK